MASIAYTKDPAVHLADIRPRPRFMKQWERLRHCQASWVIECLAEAFGVFIYCFAGMGAQAAFIVGNLSEKTTIGSLLTVGIAYGLGIVFALALSLGTSGGHLNPAITVIKVVFEGFPALKGVR
ncbi:hypothetical protein OF83DRAFT_1174667 [Amylostereum chailletii]|nr:hypothetical protein OF83DRAFT_1174667 [Amylostereum chailletii]